MNKKNNKYSKIKSSITHNIITLTRDDLIKSKTGLPIKKITLYDFKSSSMSLNEMRMAELIIFKDGDTIQKLKTRH